MAMESIKQLLTTDKIDREVTVRGWVRTKRGNAYVNFVAMNDGSTVNNLQCVFDMEQFSDEALKEVTTGACVSIVGQLVASEGKGQTVEVKATSVKVHGIADPEKFPIQPKKHSLEFLRENAHLRMRTNTFGSVFRVRHALTFAIHKYFNDRGFFNIHSPILTGTDGEGAGEMFRVTMLDPKNPPLNEDGAVDYSEDFFGKQTNLCVTGQLEAELAAMALSKVYTFGPTFRAENSNTSRHLAEFWMIEPEVAFNDIYDNMDLAEDFLKETIKYVMETCPDDLKFLSDRIAEEEKSLPQDKRQPMELLDKLKFVVSNDFARITYTEAVDILQNSQPNKKKKFEYPVDEWGVDLQSEHERFLVEKHFQKPVIITGYPAKIKAFYMKLNEDGKTVAAMDILFPGIGEIVGGSQREERYDVLMKKIEDFHIPLESVWWYMDTRKFGTVEHSGFGLGFERLMMFITGMTNVRDVIPFPRTPNNCEF
ncbi:MAG: asparagine--tRNA ligase [Flavobacteriales bacterium]|nr:asparagine--tRNA ligase [Flavobacteriales bacterium]